MSDLKEVFKAYDIRGKVGTQLSEQFATDVGRAFSDWLPKQGKVAIGRDMRPDSEKLAKAFINGLIMQGREVIDIGLVTSDMIYFAVGKYDLAGGVVITASHNPGDDNGIKLYRDQVIPVGLDSGLDKIRDAVLSQSFKEVAINKGSVETQDISEAWVDHCLTFVQDLKPYHIAIDAGNGMAGAILPKILPRLPLRVEQMYFELDGTFPNHEANPQHVENLADLTKKILELKLDFGIAFDGDGDRAALVDDKGRPVSGSDLITLVSKLYLKKYPGSKIVHEVRTSRATKEFIRQWGGEPFRTKAGRVNIGPALRQQQSPFGGETTGHLFFRENFEADSGLIAALVAMQALSDSGKKLSELIDEYHKYNMIPEISFKVNDQAAAIAKLKQAFSDGNQDELDGLSVDYNDYWFNMRRSNTEPVIKLNAEASTQQQLDELVDKITKTVSGL